KVVALHRYFQPDEYIGELCYVRSYAHTVFMWFLAAQPYGNPVCRLDTGTGGLHLLCLSRTQHHYQHRVDGRFAWCNAVRRDLSCVLDVCSCALCFLLVPCPPFHRDLPEFALRGLRFCLDLGELRCAALLPSSLAAAVAPVEESDCERRDVEASRLLKKEI